MMKIGFIGLGIMGKPMCKNLLKAGYDVTVFDIVQAAVDELVAAGAKSVTKLEGLVDSEVMITMLPDSPQVKEVVLGEGGLYSFIKPNTIFIDMSSIDPTVSRELEQKIREKGAHMIDAPVSGGDIKAIDGTLSIMCGGEEPIFNSVKEILLCMGASAVLVGGIGDGNVTKLANQIIVACNIAGMSEAMSLAKRMGVDQKKVFEAIRGGLAGSTILEAKVPMILEDNTNPGFRIDLHIKDLRNAIHASDSVELDVPFTKKAKATFEEVGELGYLKADHSAMIKFYEGEMR